MNSILVESYYDFKVSYGNITRDKNNWKIPLLFITQNISTNTQACVDSIQVTYEPKAEDINVISQQTVSPKRVK